MEKTIKSLIEFDEQGRSIVAEAQRAREEVLAHMDDYKRELAEHYEERMQSRVALFREHAEAEAAETLAQVREVHEDRAARLRETFQRERETLISEMVARCIGG